MALVSSLKGKTLLCFSKFSYEPHLYRSNVCRPRTYRRNISNDTNLQHQVTLYAKWISRYPLWMYIIQYPLTPSLKLSVCRIGNESP